MFGLVLSLFFFFFLMSRLFTDNRFSERKSVKAAQNIFKFSARIASWGERRAKLGPGMSVVTSSIPHKRAQRVAADRGEKGRPRAQEDVTA